MREKTWIVMGIWCNSSKQIPQNSRANGYQQCLISTPRHREAQLRPQDSAGTPDGPCHTQALSRREPGFLDSDLRPRRQLAS